MLPIKGKQTIKKAVRGLNDDSSRSKLLAQNLCYICRMQRLQPYEFPHYVQIDDFHAPLIRKKKLLIEEQKIKEGC